METNNNGAGVPQSGTVKPIWDVIGGQTDTVITTQTPTDTNIQTQDTIETPAIEETTAAQNTTTEPAKTEEVKETTAPNTEAKTETTDAAATTDSDDAALELTVADIKDAPTKFEDGTFQRMADELGFSINEESFEAFQQTFKDNFIPKSEVQNQIISSKEQLYKTLDPKIATAFELIEMGVPQELALNPTKLQDDYLAMDSAQLVREALAAQPGWNDDMVDAQMEELSAEPNKLEIKANIVRANLNAEKQNILQEQAQLVRKYTEQKQQIAVQQKAEQEKQFTEALAKEQEFLGLKLSKEYKDGLLANYKKGKYENVLSPEALVRTIILMESGDKFAKTALSKAKENGKAEIVKRLADVPEKKTNGAGRQQVVVADNNQVDKSPFANIPIFE